jgi:hypothetical protein
MVLKLLIILKVYIQIVVLLFFLDTAVKIRLSNRIKNDWTRINEFKTVDDALSYLKDTCKINFKTKLLNEIKESI